MHQHPHVHNLWCIDQPSTCTCQAWRRLIKSLQNMVSLQTTPWNLPRPQKNEGFVHTQARTSPVFPHNHPLPRLQGFFWGNLAVLPVQASWLAQSSRQQWFWVYYRHATATSHAPRPLKRNWRHPEQVLMLSSQGNQLCSSCNSKVVRFLADTDLKWHLSEVVLILETVLAFMMNLKYAWQHGVKNVDWGFQCGSEPSSGNTCS